MSDWGALRPMHVVQIAPGDHAFSGAFMIVEDVGENSVMGFVAIPRTRGELPGRSYYRARYDEISYVGRATWGPVEGEPPAEVES